MSLNSGSLRRFCLIKNGSTPASGEPDYWDGNVSWVTPEDLGRLTGDCISQTKRQITERAVAENNLAVLPIGSVIISTRAPIGHMAINKVPMAFNQGCRGIILGDRMYGPFLYYILKSRTPALNATANGTTFVELSRDELATIPVECPPLATQRRIARFLDEKTARIDALIETKRELLDRLAEKRQALITRAVTKGLNPNSAMTPLDRDGYRQARRRDRWAAEGVGGMTPTSGALRYFCRIKNGTTPASGEADFWDGGVLWATPEDLGKLIGDRISCTRRQVTEKAIAESNLSVLPLGSIIISTRAPIGHMAINEEPMAFNQGCRGIIPGDQLHGPFLYYLLKSRAPELNAMANGTTFVELSRDELAAISIEFPPPDTQRRIARFLDEKTARIDILTEKIQGSVECLNEYRSALITAAVTGQLEELR